MICASERGHRYDQSVPLFTGKERDAETGLDFFGARYMSSAQGRFTSVDPEFASASLVGKSGTATPYPVG